MIPDDDGAAKRWPVEYPADVVAIRMAEWETLGPSNEGQGAMLRGLTLGDDASVLRQARDLANARVLTLTELRAGLRIETYSCVGRIAVGPLRLTIVPKVGVGRWLRLFGYALGLRNIAPPTTVHAPVGPSSLQDLVVRQLIDEARDLIRHGVHREYERQRRALAVPRGRIDFARIARGGLTDARVPSRFTRRTDDTVLNRALLAALHAAVRVATDTLLRSDAVHLARELETAVTPQVLSRQLLREARRSVDRRTGRYVPALQLTELILDGTAVSLDDTQNHRTVSIRGFALNMDRLWQRLVGRVLREWVPGIDVREERVLRDIFQNDPIFSPRPRPVPKPRPDFAVRTSANAEIFLDAKYRDMWKRDLPREMLYQLSLYAAAQGGGVATMLYPTEAAEAAEERLRIGSLLAGGVNAAVALRPVHLGRLEELVAAAPSPGRTAARQAFSLGLSGIPVAGNAKSTLGATGAAP